MVAQKAEVDLREANNFDFLRLSAAFLVIWGHAFSLSGETPPAFWGTSISTIGVYIFFCLSGYLVTESWLRDSRPVAFAVKRSLRIFPALVVCVCVTALLVGPISTRLSLKEYFNHKYFFDYFGNCLLYVKYFLPGVFDNNPLKGAVNGSLWSLPVEFSCYIFVVAIGIFGSAYFHKIIWVLLIGWGATGVFFINYYAGPQIVLYGTDVKAAATVIPFFLSGCTPRVLSSQIKLRLDVSIVLIFVLNICNSATGQLYFTILLWILLPYIVLSIGKNSTPVISKAGRFGDFSYGMYLYSFPIQQLLIHANGQAFGGASMTIVSTILSLIIAYVSWHFVEKPALSYKPTKTLAKVSVRRSAAVRGV